MRRSICYCEPNSALAGQTSNWKFIYTTASHLPKGTKVRFDLGSKGRPMDWFIPRTNLKDKSNLIWAEAPGTKSLLTATEVINPHTLNVSFDFTFPVELKPGESFSIHLGSPDNLPGNGSPCQKLVQRKRPFYLYIDPKGKGDFKEPETFFLDVKGNKLKTLRIIAPSIVSRNKRFDVIIRFEDIYGNLTSNAPEGTLIDLSYQHLRENLNWKLFIPETGFIALPNLYFNEPGIYKIQLHNLQSNETFFSPPIKCLPEGATGLYWGILHGESDRVDSGKNIEAMLRHIRDDKALQFFALSSFDSEEETPNELWKAVSQQIAEFNEDDRFVAMLGFQWMGDAGEEGLRHFIYAKDNKQILRKKDTKNNSLKKIYKTNNPKEMIAIPSFTSGTATLCNFTDFNPEFERVAEIYNAWGSSECTSMEGNPRPIQGGKNGISENAEGTLVRALNKGCRIGFIAGGYDDRGCYSGYFESDQEQYSPGLTAIISKEHSRSSLIEALQNRSCYATTGERIVLGLFLAGFSMGSEIDTKLRPGLEFNRHLTGYCIGTQPLIEVKLIRNGKEYRTFPITEEKCEFEIDDSDLLGQIALEAPEGRSPFAYYYLRAMQKDGHIAWSSPIWVDLTAKSTLTLPKKNKKRSGE
ncbi:MAG TPA: DUF3604 domain-containing protein [Chlamydiales bacterium]|nr:DUF3604 domain-containing protein [Chlamydiales bacterium]